MPLALGGEGERAMCGGIVFGEGNFGVGHALGRIEHAEAEAGDEKTLGGAIDFSFRDVAGLHFVDEALIFAAAGEVGAGLDGVHGGCAFGGYIFMAAIDVADGPAIADDEAFEAPLIAQIFL